MKLSMSSFQVDRIEPANRTIWKDGTLFLNLEELKGLILKDEVIADVSIEVAHPGEKTRIIHVLDAVEPRVKVEGPSVCFRVFLALLGQWEPGEPTGFPAWPCLA